MEPDYTTSVYDILTPMLGGGSLHIVGTKVKSTFVATWAITTRVNPDGSVRVERETVHHF